MSWGPEARLRTLLLLQCVGALMWAGHQELGAQDSRAASGARLRAAQEPDNLGHWAQAGVRLPSLCR